MAQTSYFRVGLPKRDESEALVDDAVDHYSAEMGIDVNKGEAIKLALNEVVGE